MRSLRTGSSVIERELAPTRRRDVREAGRRKLIGDGGAAGRKLDFLAQEINRESNTLCSKSNAVSVTEIGLQLKLAVDQFREQVQNVE